MQGCPTRNGEKLRSSQAEQSRAINSAVAYFSSISCEASCARVNFGLFFSPLHPWFEDVMYGSALFCSLSSSLSSLAWFSFMDAAASAVHSFVGNPCHIPSTQQIISYLLAPSHDDKVLEVERDLKNKSHGSQLFLALVNKNGSLFTPDKNNCDPRIFFSRFHSNPKTLSS